MPEFVFHYIVRCNSEELLWLLDNPSIPQGVIHRSVWAFLFPHISVGKSFRLTFTLIDMDEAGKLWKMGNRPPAWDANKYVALISLYTLGYCFAYQGHLAQQIAGLVRVPALKACCAPPTEQLIQ